MNLRAFIPSTAATSLRNLFGSVRRRHWSAYGRVHVELPELTREEYEDFTRVVIAELEALDGVDWARANGALHRIVVVFDETDIDLEQILEIFDEVESRFGVGDGDYIDDGVDHPGDDEPLWRGLARMGACLAGSTAGAFMKLVRRKPGRSGLDMAALMSVVDNVPHIRSAVTDKLGRTNADMSIGLANPIIQGLGSGPIGPAVEFLYQTSCFLGALERRISWLEREPELCSHPDRAAAPLADKQKRPVPIPEGPIESYAEDAWNMSLGGFLVGLADTQKLERAITPILDALPKPARYGRGAFCAALTGVLGDLGILVMEPRSLLRLDRIDCVIVEDSLLVTDRWSLARMVAADTNRVEAYQRADDLLDPLNPELVQRKGDWTLGPADRLDVPQEWSEELREMGARGDFLALSSNGEVCALFSLRSVTDEASKAFVEAVRRADLELIISTDDDSSVAQFQADRLVDRHGVARFIGHIQRDYQVVAYFGDGPSRALAAADCGVGLRLRNGDVPWEADLIAGDRLEDTILVIDAIGRARKVSERCATLAGVGAGIGALTASSGLDDIHPMRVMFAVNTASVVALAYATYQARHLNRHRPAKTAPDEPWHRLRGQDVLDRLNSSREGLRGEYAARQESSRPERPGRFTRVVKAIGRELANPLTPVLAAGAAVSAAVGSVTDAAIVGTVIGANGLIGGFARFGAEDAIFEMSRREVVTVEVRRDGAWKKLDDDCLVIGDVIRLEAGDVVPADCRIVESERLEVDESSLTGESLPVAKNEAPSFAANVADRTSMLYDGTAVVAGNVTAVVVATGEETELGNARSLPGRGRRPESDVEKRLRQFSDMTIPLAGASGGILMSLGVLRHRKLKKLIGPAVNLAVAAVPEGLPLLSTGAQLAAARRLSDRNVLVQNQSAMEALGGVDTLCIDKTGTLTEGSLRLFEVFDGETTAEPEHFSSSHQEVLRAARCATPMTSMNGRLPHATDRAIVEGAKSQGIDVEKWDPLREIPFKSELAFHAVVGRDGGDYRLYVKGSPEAVLSRCNAGTIDDAGREELLRRARLMAGRGLRILAIARRSTRSPIGKKELEEGDVEGLEFCGFVALSDPLRDTAADAVASLQSAGVSVVMITGDHPETARRIAEEVGLNGKAPIVTGEDLERMDDEGLEQLLADAKVIARMTPAQKVRIVETYQRMGHRVAVTGDGGNDAAAIRLADAGIALGADSSTAARRAADMVVTDARIETMVDAIVEGRAMWRSMRDAVSILIGGNLGEIGFMLASGLVHSTPALNARQLLLVNLFTDVAPSLAIALRPPPDVTTEELLNEGPEKSLGEALDRDIAWRAGLTASSAFAGWMIARHTFQKKRASTVGLLSVVLAQLGQTLTVSRPSPAVWAAGLGSTAALLAIIETPGLSQLLGCKPLGPVGLTTAFATGAGAAAASAIIPRIPTWREAMMDKIPDRAEPTPRDFLEEFYAVSRL